jgi:hypothetical protein
MGKIFMTTHPKSPLDARINHNHITRDIKPLGKCPACDVYHDGQIPKRDKPEALTELAKAPKDDMLTKSENDNTSKERVNETENLQHKGAPKDYSNSIKSQGDKVEKAIAKMQAEIERLAKINSDLSDMLRQCLKIIHEHHCGHELCHPLHAKARLLLRDT